MKNKRNIAIIAHVDHGKTTLVDKLLRQTGVFRENENIRERVMDSNELERERGITIVAKNCAVNFKDVRVNIIDTPGHADFGGEVERILSMVDGVLLLVDAVEGPMPQTRFVTDKALKMGLTPIVVINKIDKNGARHDLVLDETFELFSNLGATDEQLDFPVVYASAVKGYATLDHLKTEKNMNVLFDEIISRIKEPDGELNEPFRMQISALDYSPYLGKIGIGRISRGVLNVRDTVIAVDGEGRISKQISIGSLKVFNGVNQTDVERAEVGEIVLVSGIEELDIGVTLCDVEKIDPFPVLKIDEPTLGVSFFVNSSPFAGRDGKFVTGRQLRDRLKKELKTNLALKINFGNDGEAFEVFGRGELHLTILLENLRREGFELSVSRPRVVYKESEDGRKMEPFENLVMDLDIDYQGSIMKNIGERGGKLDDMRSISDSRVRLEYTISTRALIGFHGEFNSATKGTGVCTHSFLKYANTESAIQRRKNGALVSQENGVINAYALWKIQERGTLFVEPGAEVYEGMVIGLNSRSNDLVVNPIKGKKLTNIRASGKDEHIELKNVMNLTLEKGLTILGEDELLEVTPLFLRVRKKTLTESERRKESRSNVN